jgi:hypothetical protein
MRALCGGLLCAALTLLMAAPSQSATFPFTCEKTISQGQDLDAILAADPVSTATNFCVNAGTYQVSDPAILHNGDAISGPVVSQIVRGPATYPSVPAAKLVGDTTGRVVWPIGSNTKIYWLDVSGADGEIDTSIPHSQCDFTPDPSGCPVDGKGVGISMGEADGTSFVQWVRVHHNDADGIGNCAGRIKNSEFFSNTLMPGYLDWDGSSVKCVREAEIANSYSHNEQGFGFWHDHALSDVGNVPEMASNPGGGTWFHHNLVVNNGHSGLRFEYSPRDAAEGEHLATPTFRANGNRLAGNGRGGGTHHDAQNGVWENNIFGPQTVAGVSYGHNKDNIAIRFSDSGRSDRTDLWNAVAKGNTLKGESLIGCELPDSVVLCSGNIP